jgi:hypothetical protein
MGKGLTYPTCLSQTERSRRRKNLFPVLEREDGRKCSTPSEKMYNASEFSRTPVFWCDCILYSCQLLSAFPYTGAQRAGLNNLLLYLSVAMDMMGLGLFEDQPHILVLIGKG